MNEKLGTEEPCVVDVQRVVGGVSTVILHHGELFELPPVTQEQYDLVTDVFLAPVHLVKTKEPITV